MIEAIRTAEDSYPEQEVLVVISMPSEKLEVLP
jgi:hypothetical protein